jgi:hypothetical protein
VGVVGPSQESLEPSILNKAFNERASPLGWNTIFQILPAMERLTIDSMRA